MALRMPSTAPAPTPIGLGAGRAAALPRDPGRATEVLYRRHGGTVFRYAWHLLGRREDAEDATQATFLAVHGALAGGTAVLEPGAWVLRIARNECMGRLRQTSQRPALDTLGDELAPAAVGSVESQAEVRDEMRIARRTLRLLPEPQREAFVLREWLGLETAEVALALGVAAGEVDDLTTRARRSLVLAVGGLEPAIGCAATRAAMEAGALDRAGKVHLLRCPVCRGVRRALRPRNGAAPGPVVAERLAGALPGFGVGGGGAIAALTAKATATPVITKAAALVAATLLAGGAVTQAIRTSHPVHHRSAGPALGRGGEAPAPPASGSGAQHAALVFVVPSSHPRHARVPGAALAASVAGSASASRGGAAERGDDSGSGQRSEGESGSPARGGDGGEATSSSGTGKGDHTSSGDGGARSSRIVGSSSGDGSSSRTASDSPSTSDGGGSAVTGRGDNGSSTTTDGTSGHGGDTTASAADGGGDGTATPAATSGGGGDLSTSDGTPATTTGTTSG